MQIVQLEALLCRDDMPFGDLLLISLELPAQSYLTFPRCKLMFEDKKKKKFLIFSEPIVLIVPLRRLLMKQ